MNNSLNIDPVDLSLEESGPDLERLRERESKLVKLIEALGSLRKNKEWSTLKEELFDDALDTLDRKQATEAEKSNIDLPTLYRIQGQKAWVRRYDFDYLTEMYRLELANIRKQLNPSAPGV